MHEGRALPMRKARWFAMSRSRWRAMWTGLLLVVLPFWMFWQIWWPQHKQRQVFAYGDFVEQHYPMRTFVARELRQGRLPLWDPYTFGGEPAIAESLFATLYPLGWWQALFPGRLPFEALEIEAILHLGLAGIFTCLFVRRLTHRLDAGLLAGVAFSLGGFLTSYPMLQLIILETAIWLPAGLWLIERALARRSLWEMGIAGAALGCGILAGHFQTFLYIAYLTAAYFLFRAFQLRVGWRFALAAALTLAGVTVGLSAGQWLPSLEIARVSPRAQLSYAELSKGFAPSELWGLIRPNPEQWSPLYVGLIPLVLGLLSPILSGRHRLAWLFWMVILLLALLLSLGANGFLYPMAYRVAPGFNLFRQQERAALLVSFALAVLAGYGYAGLAWRRWWPRWALAFVLGLTFLDLFLANNSVILQTPPPGGYFASTPALEYLLHQERDSPWRVSTESLLPGDGNAGLVYQLRDVIGSGPLYLAHFERFLERVPELRWWQMLNVRYVVTRRHLDHGALLPVLEADDQHVYQLFLGGQPAWIVHDWQLAADGADAIERTADPALDPLRTAILEEAPVPVPQPAAGSEEVRVSAFAHQRVTVDVTLSAPGIVVLSEVFYPGWIARVDGQRVSTLRAYGLLRAVALPAGQWRIEWRFEPLTAWVGLAISAVTVLVLTLTRALRLGRMHRHSSRASI